MLCVSRAGCGVREKHLDGARTHQRRRHENPYIMSSHLGDLDDNDPISAAALRHSGFRPPGSLQQEMASFKPPPQGPCAIAPSTQQVASLGIDDDPISAAARKTGHSFSLPSFSTPTGNISQQAGISAVGASSAVLSPREDPKYDAATMMLDQAIAAHATTAASAHKAARSSKSKKPTEKTPRSSRTTATSAADVDQGNINLLEGRLASAIAAASGPTCARSSATAGPSPSTMALVGLHPATPPSSKYGCLVECCAVHCGQRACHFGSVGCCGKTGCCACVTCPNLHAHADDHAEGSPNTQTMARG